VKSGIKYLERTLEENSGKVPKFPRQSRSVPKGRFLNDASRQILETREAKIVDPFQKYWKARTLVSENASLARGGREIVSSISDINRELLFPSVLISARAASLSRYATLHSLRIATLAFCPSPSFKARGPLVPCRVRNSGCAAFSPELSRCAQRDTEELYDVIRDSDAARTFSPLQIAV